MSRCVVGVLDYGAGNLKSVQHALEHCGAEVTVIGRARELSRVTHLVLPGVGAMATAMSFLMGTGLDLEIQQFAAGSDRPILGICLGMQMLATRGVEGGSVGGLNILGGVVEPVPHNFDVPWNKTPRIGWMGVAPGPNQESFPGRLLPSSNPDSKYYFAHSFHLIPDDRSVISAVVSGDPAEVVAAVQHGNVYGTQFHPEKSGVLGLAVLRRFLEGAEFQGVVA